MFSRVDIRHESGKFGEPVALLHIHSACIGQGIEGARDQTVARMAASADVLARDGTRAMIDAVPQGLLIMS
jgi:hypothetical protein